jgi:hypothetical protein
MNLTIRVLTCVVAANTFFLAETRRASHSAQTIPELARQKPANPVVRGRLVDIWPATLEELTTSADLVLDATLTKLKSYFTQDEEEILTDYAIGPTRIFLGQVSPVRAIPGTTNPLLLSFYGGEMTIEGFTVSVVDYAIPAPKNGGRYLLFLRRFGTEGRYQLNRGGAFEIVDQDLKALVQRNSEILFKDVIKSPFDEVATRIASIVAAIKK